MPEKYHRVLAAYQDTSREAWDAVWALLPAVDAQIVRVIARSGGATSDEVEARTGLKHQTVSAQIRHMVEGGLLEDSGARRANANRRQCMVWQLAARRQPVREADAVSQGALF